MTAPPRALHLPGLPEVSVQIGVGSIDGPEVVPTGVPAARPRPALSYRLQQALASYLPLLLMGLLALMTAWLVQHTPTPDGPAAPRAVRESADYTMSGFAIQRFGPDGREILRIAGDRLRHFPLTDQLEIEGVRIHAVAPDGRLTDAVARRALVMGDGSEVKLMGGAQVVSQLGAGEALEVKGEFLHAFVGLGHLRSHLPVLVRRGASITQAGGLDYDHRARQLTLLGPVRVTVPAPASGAIQP